MKDKDFVLELRPDSVRIFSKDGRRVTVGELLERLEKARDFVLDQLSVPSSKVNIHDDQQGEDDGQA